VSRVREVLRGLSITSVPLAPPEIAGLINLRGQVLMAIDLRRCLSLPPRPADQSVSHMIVELSRETISLLIDEPGPSFTLDPAQLVAPPSKIVQPIRELLEGAHLLPDRLLLIIDLLRLSQSTSKRSRREPVASG
jgi:purine-binding chemotaxis protein CheW